MIFLFFFFVGGGGARGLKLEGFDLVDEAVLGGVGGVDGEGGAVVRREGGFVEVEGGVELGVGGAEEEETVTDDSLVADGYVELGLVLDGLGEVGDLADFGKDKVGTMEGLGGCCDATFD